ncbi:MAG: response regulator [Phycisphaeraceae bacterium]|nr:MAG: response regulator [Phycisphaeraceae bacterium]
MDQTILIVESSTLIARTLAEAAERYGLEPVFATDFRTAVDAIIDSTPAFIATAKELDGMPGTALVAALRASPAHRVIPAAFVTSCEAPQEHIMWHGCRVFDKSPKLREAFQKYLESFGFEPRESGATPKDEVLRGRKLLVAEDMDAMRRLISHKLHVRGAKVTLAHDGFEAGVAGLAQPYDLIVLDIEMPRLDGRDVIHLLRESGVKTPVIAMTAHTDELIVADLQKSHGFDDVISKKDAVEAIARDMAYWDSTRAA